MMPSERIKSDDFSENSTWTDGLPKCHLSGVGMSTSELYCKSSLYEHEYEDRSIYFCLNEKNSTFLYGVFDGHDGVKAANFASQRIPAELSFEQLDGKTMESDIREVFKQSFISVESAFLESIDPKIAERSQLLEKIPPTMSHSDAVKMFPGTVTRLQHIEQELRSGATAVVALVHADTLYVGNVGDCRALLCQEDKCGVLKVKQLTTDHTTNSIEELDRLSSLSLNVERLKGVSFGGHAATRCIGNYFLKGGYRENEFLRPAKVEPIISHPSIISMPIDDSFSLLLLMSNGLYRSYEEATGSTQVNKDIATMVVEQFLEQTTLMNVAQTVVDKVVNLHRDLAKAKGNLSSREDITLIVRKFNFRSQNMLHAQTQYIQRNQNFTGAKTKTKNLSPKSSSSSSGDATLVGPTLHNQSSHSSNFYSSAPSSETSYEPSEYSQSENTSIFHDSDTTSTESSRMSNPSLKQLTLDENERIRPYVSFDNYFEKVEQAINSGLISKDKIHLYK